MMYTQQVAHLPPGVASAKDLADLIDKKLDPTRYAVILHDQDTDENSQPVAPHIHAMLCFSNARHISAVAKKLGDKPQYIEKWDGQAGNGFAYLVHQTKKARDSGKYPYDCGAVTANFDFECLVKTMGARSIANHARGNASDIQGLLDLLYIGGISKKELESQLSGSQYARYHHQIEEVNAKRLVNEAEKWREEMKSQNARISVIWLYGYAGTGKTSLAKECAQKKGQPYFISGSSRDIFQGYNGEHTLIMDELRPKMMEYSDLLRITDPYGIENQVMAPSRYNDKALACDLIIITSPFSPSDFYFEQANRVMDKKAAAIPSPDGIEQLLRRISVTIEMTEAEIQPVEYKKDQKNFFPIPNTARPNQYSKQARPQSMPDPVTVFVSIFDS